MANNRLLWPGLIFHLWLAAGPVLALEVPLMLTNRETTAQVLAPVVSGVPLPAGALADGGPVRLLRGGSEVPAQFLTAARWPDGSVRWLLVSLETDLPAGGAVSFILQTGAAPAPVSGLALTDTVDSLTVATGAAVFHFTKTELLLGVNHFEATAGGTTYRAVPVSSDWEVEENGPIKAVVRVRGDFRNGAVRLGNSLVGFQARLTFWKDRSDFQAALTFSNRNGYNWDGNFTRGPSVTLTAAAAGVALLAPGGHYVFGQGVEKTWEISCPAAGAPTVRDTRFRADGSLDPDCAPPPPLLAAPPSWYAATGAWGEVAPPVGGLPAARQADFDAFERLQRAKVRTADIIPPPGGGGYTLWQHLAVDLTSWNDYGDLRWAGNGCGSLSGNHYDWSYGMYLQFMRTGLLPFADAAHVMARHEIDFDVYHTAADGQAYNYQKEWEDRPSHDSSDNCFGGGRPSHTWTQGYALQWLLRGDRRGLDAFDELQEGIRQYIYESFNGEGYISTTEIRVQGWLVENLVNLWRIKPDMVLATSDYGNKTVPQAIRDVLAGVFTREAEAGRAGFVWDGDPPSPGGISVLQMVYFLEPAIKAHQEVFLGRDTAYADQLLGLVRRMTDWLISVTYGGNTTTAGYRPRQIPYHINTALPFDEQGEGQVAYLLMAANGAAYCWRRTGVESYRTYSRAAFQDWSRYSGITAGDEYIDPARRSPACYDSPLYTDTESKVHGWSNRYGQYFLAMENMSLGGSRPSGTDFTQDGRPDLLWRQAAGGTASLWQMNGLTWQASLPFPTVDPAWTIAGLADFNGDGQADLLWRNPSTGADSLWLMLGRDVTSQVWFPTVDPTWTVGGLGDFDGDADADLLWRNSTTGQLAVWFLQGGAYSSGTYLGTVNAAWEVASVADFNFDHRPDLLWRHGASGALVIWYLNGTAVTGTTYLGAVPVEWAVAGSFDFDGNGYPDLLWRHGDPAILSVWLYDGLGFSSVAPYPTAAPDAGWVLAR